ncbi:MAG: ammonium transporter [bacterium]|nr:ammonium transporter [bacterium]
MKKILMILTILTGLFATGWLLAEEPAATPAVCGVAAEPAPAAINTGDTAWILMSTALVMMMTAPGLAMFYGGLVRRKNVLSTMMQSFFLLGLISVQWILWGYSLSFGPDIGHFIGSLKWFALSGVGSAPNPDYAGTIPHNLFMIYQMMFAVITPALITGAFAERIKFSTFAVFSLLWATLVYDPVCHWVWGTGGWLKTMGALDFAGGTVVHISSGISALVFALMIGKRKNYPARPVAPHNMVFTLLGAALLWFGWFGFNAGSALGANELAVTAFIATNTAAATAALVWLFLDWLVIGKPTALGGASGAVAGLVAVTPAAGFVTPMGALGIGILVALVCYLFVSVLKHKFGYDDSLDAFGVHGVGGTVGALATGLFATKMVNAAGNNGLFYGNASLLWTQAIGVIATMAYAAAVTFVLLKILDKVMGLRVKEEEELIGLDITQHKETAYTLVD